MSLQRGAQIEMLQRRAAMLAQMRAFFAERGVLEVETSSISAAATPDPALESMTAMARVTAGYLHTSPEYMMKRLLSDGSGDIYQLCRVYRDGESGKWHEPEFMLLEWYRLGFDEHALMDEVDTLLTALLGRRLRSASQRITWDAALHSVTGLTRAADTGAFTRMLNSHGIDVPEHCSMNDLLNLAMATVVSASFPPATLTFVHDYPASQAALAQIKDNDRDVAGRFEVFLGRLELGNGFCELTDAHEQRTRFTNENAARAAAGQAEMPIDEAFLAALEAGLPECAGVALGFDRIVAAATDAQSVADVVAFTHQPLSP